MQTLGFLSMGVVALGMHFVGDALRWSSDTTNAVTIVVAMAVAGVFVALTGGFAPAPRDDD